MGYPQVATGKLLPFLNPTAQVGATYTANHGDLVEYTPTGASTITLPAASLAGVVAVINLAAFAITIKTAEGAANNIQGVAGNTGYVLPAGGVGAAATQAVCVSDGTSWWVVSR